MGKSASQGGNKLQKQSGSRHSTDSSEVAGNPFLGYLAPKDPRSVKGSH